MLSNNFFNLDLGEILAVTVQFLIPFPAFLLKHEDFVVFEVFKYSSFHRGPFYNRCAYLNLTVGIREQHPVETYGRPFIFLKTVNIKFPTLLSFELLTCYFYNYKHNWYKMDGKDRQKIVRDK